MIHSIYKIVNQINGKVYIGYTTNPKSRLRTHKHNSKKLEGAFYSAVRKYGWDNFIFEIIYQSFDENHCHNVMEEYFIREYKSHVDEGFGYNMSYGGEGQINPSEKTRYKIGTANRGKKRNSLSEETKRKIGLANSQKKRTDKQKEHLREINLGKKQSEKSIAKRCKGPYIVVTPTGETINVLNLTQFCKINGLNQGAMSAIARGKLHQHKGWSCQFS